MTDFVTGSGQSGKCEDGLDGAVPIANGKSCAPGTDCSDCGHRASCTSCSSECAALTTCLEGMYKHEKSCFDACNVRECQHNNMNCNKASRQAKCTSLQSGADFSNLVDIPIHDATTLVTTGSTADDAETPLSLGVGLHDVILAMNSVSNKMEASFGFAISMQWQDSRLATSPCALVYPDTLQLSGTSSSAERAAAAAMTALFWNPDSLLTILASDRKTAATVAYDVQNFSYSANASWLTGSGPPGFESCTSCVTMVYTGSATVVQANPDWKYDYFPFDRHNISFIISIAESNMSTCSDAFGLMTLTSIDEAARKLLPATQEWSFFTSSLAESIELLNPNGDASKCEIRIHVRRNALVFIIKQLSISMLVVVVGLCALFLHAADHTGDRVALLLVSALIVTTSFQTDIGLGAIQYLIWFDYWNLAQLAILVPCLAICLYEHRMMMTDQEEWANIVNKATKWMIPFGFYPILCAALFIWGIGHDDPPSGPNVGSWVVLIVGWSLATLYVVRRIRVELHRERGRREASVALLTSTSPTDNNFLAILRDAFIAFDTDDSGDISLQEMREMLENIFPDASRIQFAAVMKDLRGLADNSNAFDEASFLDAVLLAFQALRPEATVDFGKTSGSGTPRAARARIGKLFMPSTSKATLRLSTRKQGEVSLAKVAPYAPDVPSSDSAHIESTVLTSGSSNRVEPVVLG